MRFTAVVFFLGSFVTSSGWAQQPETRLSGVDFEAEMEVHDTVVQFLDLLGGLRFDALGDFMTEDANIITARWSRSGFVNSVQTRDAWIVGLAQAPPRPFREVLSNVEIDIASAQLALVKADFTIVRDTGVASRGIDFFTLIKSGDERRWKLASIAFTSTPAPEPER